MTVFFTSDTHFGHEAIIRLTGRPFGSVEEMDAALIARWNETVSPDDTVYHLGDVCFRNSRSIGDYIGRLNGAIHLIRGNHDADLSDAEANALFASVSLIRELHIGRRMIVRCHYPMREWNQCKRGSWHLFGHVHGRLDGAPLGWSLDAGVESHGFRPWSFTEIEAVFAGRDNPFLED
jgi:calcineurin-like phosphoesterase family protein